MTEGRSLHRKLAEVMAEAERIPKRGKAPAAMGGFPFVQVGDAADHIRKALGERHISMLPTAVEIIGQSEHATKSGGTMTTVELRTTWTLTDGESGESTTIQSYGAGADGGDKYSGKAQTNAMKYALLMGFLLSTGEDVELSNSEDRVIPAPEKTDDGGLIGVVEKGTAKDSDLELRETPDGWAIGFRLKANGRGGIKVIARDALAQAIAAWSGQIVGQRVTCWGRIADETFRPKDSKRDVTYQVMQLERLQTPDFILPAPPALAPEQVGMLLTDEEKAAISGNHP